jgi:hypothetical protein
LQAILIDAHASRSSARCGRQTGAFCVTLADRLRAKVVFSQKLDAQ